jgi:hypothetical protein
MLQPIETRKVYQMLKNREIHPSGKFDDAGRFYAEHNDLINVRAPSRRWPYSEMVACRTHKYVKAVAKRFNCQTVEELKAKV